MLHHQQVTVYPSSLQGHLQAPRSKSSMQRACAAALLRNGLTSIHHPGRSNDDLAALQVIQQLGAMIMDDGDLIRVSSKGIAPVAAAINCGESGLGVRMFTPLAALAAQPVTITGTGSLLARPLDFFDTVLPQLGVTVTTSNGKLPLQVQGPLQPRDIEVDGALSSQFLTGLLMAYSAAGADGVTIRVNNLASKPYIDLTLQVMRQFGMAVPDNSGYQSFSFTNTVPPQSAEISYTVEGDWSGGAFLLVAGALAGPVTVRGLDMMSTQADKAITEALIQARAGIAIEAGAIKVHPAKLQAFQFDATHCPDLFPPLVALAAYCAGTTVIKGVQRLTHKESDRGAALQQEFAKMGVDISITGDNLLVHGGVQVQGATVDAHNDHRIAMATATAALAAVGETVITGADAINKSYPRFYEHLKVLGARITT